MQSALRQLPSLGNRKLVRFESARVSDQRVQVDQVDFRTVVSAQPAPNIKGIRIPLGVDSDPDETCFKWLLDQRPVVSGQRLA